MKTVKARPAWYPPTLPDITLEVDRKRASKSKANGGWGDKRDQDLCMSFVS